MPYFHLFQQELNSIDLKIAKDIQRRLEAWSENDMITAVVLQGEGGCYCGGVDLDWLSAHREHTADLYAAVGDLYSSISKYPKPIVSMINGDVSGSGLGLANTPFRVVADSSRFSVPEPSFGLVPDGPVLRMLTKADKTKNQPLAAFLCLTGQPISALEMVDLGLATHVVEATSVELITRHLSSISYIPQGELHDVIKETLAIFCDASTDPLMAQRAWETVKEPERNDSFDDTEKTCFPWSFEEQELLQQSFSSEDVTETWTLLEEKASVSKWAEEALNGMRSNSPIGLLATRRLLSRVASMSEDDAAALAQQVAVRLASGPGFSLIAENASRGIEAPLTTLADLEAVKEAELETLFTP